MKRLVILLLVSVWACGSDSSTDTDTDPYNSLSITYSFSKPHDFEISSEEEILLLQFVLDGAKGANPGLRYPSDQIITILWTAFDEDTTVVPYEFTIRVNGELVHEVEGETILGFGYIINPS